MANTICAYCRNIIFRDQTALMKQQRNFCNHKCKDAYYSKRKVIKEPNTHCVQCGNPIWRKPSQVAKYTKHFCCKECHVLYQQKDQVAIKCDECGKIFYRKKSRAKRGPTGLAFCSHTCVWIYGHRQFKKHHFDSANYRRPVAYCQLCGWNEVEQLLSIHWLDGSSTNKDDSNILVVCPICREKIKAGLLPQYQDRG